MGEIVVLRLVGSQIWKDAFDMHVVNAGTEHSVNKTWQKHRVQSPALLSIPHFLEWPVSSSVLGICPDPQHTDLCTQQVLKNVPSLD